MNVTKLRPTSRTWWDHMRARAAARLRQAGVQRQLSIMTRGMHRDLRAARRDAETAVAVRRSELTVAAARWLGSALARVACRSGSASD